MTRVLGIDGGGTTTRLVLADGDGHILGARSAASINLDDHPREHAVRVLREAVGTLAGAGGNHAWAVDAAIFAVGGVASDRDRGAMRSVAVEARVAAPERIGVHHDAFAALQGALLGRGGMLLVLGTGSVCFGRTDDGREAKCGNWGPLLGDEGSGHWLGLEAVRAVVRSHDGREGVTALSGDVLAALDIGHPYDVLRRIHESDVDRTRIAGLAPILLRHAADGDALARDILDRGCALLAECVAVVHRRLFLQEHVELAFTGGLTKSATYMAAMEKRLGVVPDVRLADAALPPVLGAVRLALAMAGRAPTPAVDARLAAAQADLPDAF